uniref:Uncharacterized protein n=1 Tax=Rhizophora mucronata TaxID=61149 RepID=A0A2P2NLN8_RHIMU
MVCAGLLLIFFKSIFVTMKLVIYLLFCRYNLNLLLQLSFWF